MHRLLPVVSMIAGVLLLIFGFNIETPRLQRIPELSLGFFLFLIPFGYLYIRTSIHHNISKSVDHNISKSSDLKILDWAFVIFMLEMMICLDLVDLPSFFWHFFVTFPFITGRIVIAWYVKSYKRNAANEKERGENE